MPSLKDHLAHGSVAAVLAIAAATGAVNLKAPVVEQVKHEIAVSKHAWPDLTDADKAALVTMLTTLPKSVKFDIVCNEASCDDLAEDIDDAMETAGLASSLDHSVGPLGYGIGVQVNAADKAAADQAAAGLKQATQGALDVPVTIAKPGQNMPGYVTILIGKYRK